MSHSHQPGLPLTAAQTDIWIAHLLRPDSGSSFAADGPRQVVAPSADPLPLLDFSAIPCPRAY